MLVGSKTDPCLPEVFYVRTAIADSVGEEVKRKIRNMADRLVVLSDGIVMGVLYKGFPV
jgi:hypothetical protein